MLSLAYTKRKQFLITFFKKAKSHLACVFTLKYLNKIEDNVLFLNLLKDKIKDPVCLFFV